MVMCEERVGCRRKSDTRGVLREPVKNLSFPALLSHGGAGISRSFFQGCVCESMPSPLALQNRLALNGDGQSFRLSRRGAASQLFWRLPRAG